MNDGNKHMSLADLWQLDVRREMDIYVEEHRLAPPPPQQLGSNWCYSDFPPHRMSELAVANQLTARAPRPGRPSARGKKSTGCGCSDTPQRGPSPASAETLIASRAKPVGRPRGIRKSLVPSTPGTLPWETADRIFEKAIDRVMVDARPLVIRIAAPPTLLEHRYGGMSPSPMANQLDLKSAAVVLAMIPELPEIHIPEFNCVTYSHDWIEEICETFVRCARYMYYAKVINDLMRAQTESLQEALWNDTCLGHPETRPSMWFGSFSPSRRGRLHNRLAACFERRYQGEGTDLKIHCWTYATDQTGKCEGCKYGASMYHGVKNHICICDEAAATNDPESVWQMLHEGFHWIDPGLLDHHICWEVPKPWKGDSVYYAGFESGLAADRNPNDKWHAPAEMLQGCPEQALRNCDSYAHWVRYVGLAVDAGTVWPATTILPSNHSPGGGGGDLDCNPNSLDGMCILYPEEEQW